jgi:polar amino acid transport system substrate-binding protein
LTDALTAGAIDIAFTPIDDERRKRVDFSPPYFVIESTYLVAGASDIHALADIDRPAVTIVGIDGSTTIRAAGRTAPNAKIIAAKSVDDAMAMLIAGTANALALTHDSLPRLQGRLPGSRILDGAFQTTGVAIAVRKDRPAALASVTAFIEDAKRSGLIRTSFDQAGLNQLSVAP